MKTPNLFSVASFCFSPRSIVAALASCLSLLLALSTHGDQWETAIGAATINDSVNSVLVLGDVYVGGKFTSIGSLSASKVARWDGTKWYAMAGGVSGGTPEVSCVAGVGTNIFVGGRFTTAGSGGSAVTVVNIARWDGVRWSDLGGGPSSGPGGSIGLKAVLMLNGSTLVVGGTFPDVNGTTGLHGLAQYNVLGQSWGGIGTLDTADVRCMAVSENGDLFIGGDFTTIDGTTVNRIAMRPASTGTWQALPNSVLGGVGFPGAVEALVIQKVSGGYHVLASGNFSHGRTDCTGNPSNIGADMKWVAVWDGTSLQSASSDCGVANSLQTYPKSLAVNNGTVYAGANDSSGNYSFYQWNGAQSWSVVSGGVSSGINAMGVSRYDGDIYVVGSFTTVGSSATACSKVARYNSSPAPLTLVDLSASFSATSSARGLNNDGTAVGSATLSSGATDGVRWNLTSFESYGMSGYPTTTPASANGINAGASRVVGTNFTTYYGTSRGWIWIPNGGVSYLLHGLAGASANVIASAVSDGRTAVGSAQNSSGIWRAVAWYDSGNLDATDLGSFYGGSYAFHINNREEVVGRSQTYYPGGWRAFRTSPGGTVSSAVNLGTLNGPYGGDSRADAISDGGYVAGAAGTYGTYGAIHAFRTSPYAVIDVADDLGALSSGNSYATSVNANGVTAGYNTVVGYYTSTDTALLFSLKNVIDLNTMVSLPSGWTLRRAYGINDRGQIVGVATDGSSVQRAFMLNP